MKIPFFSSISTKKILLLGLFFLLTCLGVILWNMFHYFEFADEGIYLYLAIQGKKTYFLSPYHALLHPFGILFNHKLIGYRLLRLVASIGVSLYLGQAIWKKFLEKNFSSQKSTKAFLFISIVILNFFSYSQTTTFSYNTLSFCAAAVWLGSLYNAITNWENQQRAKTTRYTFLMGIALIVAVFARPPFGIALLGIDLCVGIIAHSLYKIPFWKFQLTKWLVFIALIIPACLYYQELLLSIPKIMSFHTQNTHSNVLFSTKEAIIQFLIAYLGYGALFWFFLLKEPISAIRIKVIAILGGLYGLGTWLISLLNLNLFLVFNNLGKLAYIGSAIFFTYNAHEDSPNSFSKKFAEHIFLVGTCFFASIASSLGTNIDFIGHVAEFAAPIFFSPLLVALLIYSKGLSTSLKNTLYIILPFWITALVFVISNTFILPYRTYEPFYKVNYLSHSPFLDQIRLPHATATNINALLTELNKSGFDPKKDRIFAYTDCAGLIAATGAPSFGMSWTGTEKDHPGSIEQISRYFTLEPFATPIRYVYIVRSQAIDPPVREELNKLLEPGPGFHQNKIGTTGNMCIHLGSFRKYHLTFEGPYIYAPNLKRNRKTPQ